MSLGLPGNRRRQEGGGFYYCLLLLEGINLQMDRYSENSSTAVVCEFVKMIGSILREEEGCLSLKCSQNHHRYRRNHVVCNPRRSSIRLITLSYFLLQVHDMWFET